MNGFALHEFPAERAIEKHILTTDFDGMRVTFGYSDAALTICVNRFENDPELERTRNREVVEPEVLPWTDHVPYIDV